MDALPALLAFAFAASVTPGPNVIMVAASSANHGVRATLPHMAGISVGFPAMTVFVGLGLASRSSGLARRGCSGSRGRSRGRAHRGRGRRSRRSASSVRRHSNG
jgi:hypothetical protein